MPAEDLPNKVFDLLLQYEGKPRLTAYRDSNKKLWTIGIGTLIGDDEQYRKSPYYNRSITADEAKALARRDIEKKTQLISGIIGAEKFDSFSPELQAHLVSGAYRGDITGSPKTIELLKSGDFEGAAKEYLNNEEYRRSNKGSAGVVTRMNDAAAVMAKEKPVDFNTAVENAISNADRFVGPPTPEQARDIVRKRSDEATARGEGIVVKPLRNPLADTR